MILIETSRRFDAVDWSGHVLWQRAADPGHVVAAAGRFLITDRFEQVLLCLRAQTGEVVWAFEPPKVGAANVSDRSNVIASGFPSVAVLGDRVIVIPRSNVVHVLALDSGEVISAARPPFIGWYLITERSIFFKQPFGLSEFDHREMKEIDRIEYRADVEPLYEHDRPGVNAFCLTEESVIWTTMHGVLMGVSRQPGEDGKRVAWRQLVPGAIMPIGEAPVSFGRYLYFTKKGEAPELQCYRSVVAG